MGKESVTKCIEESYKGKPKDEREGESNTMLDGRNLIISVAVDRRKARELAEKEKTTKKKKQDKKNLYLAYEGVITEQDEAAEDMSPGDFVSTTRLSIRNIPKEYTEKHLR